MVEHAGTVSELVSKVSDSFGGGMTGYTRVPLEEDEEPGSSRENQKGSKQSLAHVRRLENLFHDHENENVPWTEALIESNIFQAFMGSLIVANAVVIGLETDMPRWPHWDEVEGAFLLVFALELLLRLYVQGYEYFFWCKNPEVSWNIFDFMVVTMGCADMLMGLVRNLSGGGVATLFRIIRLLRIMRLFRIIKFLKQLYLLAFGFIDAVHAVFWVTILMTVVLYVCSIVMVRTCGRLPESDPHHKFLHLLFGDISTSMMTLFVLMSSPNLPTFIDEEGLLESKPFLALFLVGFVIIGSFGMIALLTGVISESMFEKNQLRVEESRKDLEQLIQALETNAADIHAKLPLDERGEATREDVLRYAMPLVAKLFEAALVDFTETNLIDLVDFMDLNGTGCIDSHEFTRAICTYAAGLKPLSIQEVNFNISSVLHRLDALEEHLMGRLNGDLPPHYESAQEEEQALRRRLAKSDLEKFCSLGRYARGGKKAKTVQWSTNQAKEQTKPQRSMTVAALPNSQASSRNASKVIPEGVPSTPVAATLERNLREMTERHIKAQVALETQLKQKLDEIREHIKEDLKLVLRSLGFSPPTAGSLGGDQARRPPLRPTAADYHGDQNRSRLGDSVLQRGTSTGHDKGFPVLSSLNPAPPKHVNWEGQYPGFPGSSRPDGGHTSPALNWGLEALGQGPGTSRSVGSAGRPPPPAPPAPPHWLHAGQTSGLLGLTSMPWMPGGPSLPS
mmetsp:Transcript_7384/g.20943  ORF Transcript_7384/g.20943 Transcript_7384/m.20943 type:complete len:735 (-) Transcript_7384:150-2354(-)